MDKHLQPIDWSFSLPKKGKLQCFGRNSITVLEGGTDVSLAAVVGTPQS